VPQPLRRLITPLLGFSIKPFLKRFALRRLISVAQVYHAVARVFDQTFSQKVCGQAFL
jgi:hypothetical protein